MVNAVCFYAGLLAGLSVAAPIGPMAMLCLQRTLTAGVRTGISTGLGGATGNVLLASVVLLGLDSVIASSDSARRVLGIVGGCFLLWSAVRTLFRKRVPPGRAAAVASPLACYGAAVAYNVTNPVSLVLIVALLTPMAGQTAHSPLAIASVLAGMFIAVAAWWVCFNGAVALLRTRLTPAWLQFVNQAAGVGLTVYGTLVLLRAAAP